MTTHVRVQEEENNSSATNEAAVPTKKGGYHRTLLCAHTPRYLALGTSSTGLGAVSVGPTLGVLHLPL